MEKRDSLISVQTRVEQCRKCERLVEWRERVAVEKTRRYSAEEYWGRAVPGFGDLEAGILIIGLAPAAHGGNRTGRMFTGDRSGEWLYRALYRVGFASRSISVSRDDGLVLKECYITAVVHCAPPENKPTTGEISDCFPYLLEEIKLLKRVRIMVGLGRLAFDSTVKAIEIIDQKKFSPKPLFKHGAVYTLREELSLIASYHPSQRNTFTGTLTEGMFDGVFERAKLLMSQLRGTRRFA